jgi:cell division transport system permease protein
MSQRLNKSIRVFSGGLRNFLRNAWLSSAAILVMVATISVVLLTLAAYSVYKNQSKELVKKISISINLKDDITEEQKNELETSIKTISGVESIKYVSKEEALLEAIEENPDIFDERTIAQSGNIIPAKFEIIGKNINDLDEINTKISSLKLSNLIEESINTKEQKEETIRNISNWYTVLKKIGIVSASVLCGISILIVVNTIRMAIFSRKDEIEIMKLLGASKLYIKGPFLIEAGFYGLFSGLIAWALTRALISRVDNGELGSGLVFFSSHQYLIMFGSVLAGIIICVLASQLAIRKYIKIKSY